MYLRIRPVSASNVSPIKLNGDLQLKVQAVSDRVGSLFTKNRPKSVANQSQNSRKTAAKQPQNSDNHSKPE